MRNVLVGLVAGLSLVSAAQAAVVALDMQTGKSGDSLYADALISVSGTTLQGVSPALQGLDNGYMLTTKAASDYYFANNIWGNSSNGTDGLPTNGLITSSTYGALQFTYGADSGNSPAAAVRAYNPITFTLVPSQQASYDKLLLAAWMPWGDKSANITVTYADATTTVFSGFQFNEANASETLLSGLDIWNGKLDTSTINNGEGYQNNAGQKLYLYTLNLDNTKTVQKFDLSSGGEVVLYDTFGVQAVPEPTSMAVLALGGLGLMRRRRD